MPIKDTETLSAMKAALLASSPKYGKRNLVIFLFGTNTGLRCGDILQLRMRDIVSPEGSIYNKILLLEEKTGKRRTLFINDTLREALSEYVQDFKRIDPDAPLFPSRKTGERREESVKDNTDCLSVKSYWRILKEAGETLRLAHIGTHTMRKTFGYAVYAQYAGKLVQGKYSAIDVVQKVFNHSSSNVTMRYIGLDEELMENVYTSISL